MPKEDWQVGYIETKNFIHNEIGMSKEELKEVFRKIAKEEIKQIIVDNRPFIFATMKDVIRNEMIAAVSEHRYPKISGNMHIYGSNGGGDSFKDYISGVMKEEIVNELRKQFSIDVNVSERGRENENANPTT